MNAEQVEAAAVERSKREILADVASGTVPAGVLSFSALHGYVDANAYGGLCDGDWHWLADDLVAANAVQSAVDAWLRSGGIVADSGAVQETLVYVEQFGACPARLDGVLAGLLDAGLLACVDVDAERYVLTPAGVQARR